jgi:ribosome-binding protein aMBF1 (putative translation factor)
MGSKDASSKRIRFVEDILRGCLRTLDKDLRTGKIPQTKGFYLKPEPNYRGLKHSVKFKEEFAMWQKNFGVVVRRLRKKRRLSRPELARLAKFSVSILAHIEQGHGSPGLDRMFDLADALKHRLSYMFKLAQELNEKSKQYKE